MDPAATLFERKKLIVGQKLMISIPFFYVLARWVLAGLIIPSNDNPRPKMGTGPENPLNYTSFDRRLFVPSRARCYSSFSISRISSADGSVPRLERRMGQI